MANAFAISTLCNWETPELVDVVHKGRHELRERFAQTRATKEEEKRTARKRLKKRQKERDAAAEKLSLYEQGMMHEGEGLNSDEEKEIGEDVEAAEAFWTNDKTKGTVAFRRKFPKVAEAWFGPLPDAADIAQAKDALNTVEQEVKDAEEAVQTALWNSDSDDYEGDEIDKELRTAEKAAVLKTRLAIDKKRKQQRDLEAMTDEQKERKEHAARQRRENAANKRERIKEKIDAYDNLMAFKEEHENDQKHAEKQKKETLRVTNLLKQAEKAKDKAEETTREERTIVSDWIYSAESKPAGWDAKKMHSSFMRFSTLKKEAAQRTTAKNDNNDPPPTQPKKKKKTEKTAN